MKPKATWLLALVVSTSVWLLAAGQHDKHTYKKYRHLSPHGELDQFGFDVTYPSDLFKLTPAPNGIVLKSKYYGRDNPSDRKGHDIYHRFTISVEVKFEPIEIVLRKRLPAEKTENILQLFQPNSNQSLQREENNYVIEFSFEGNGKKEVFIPTGPDSTILATLDWFNTREGGYDKLVDYPFTDQLRIFRALVESIHSFSVTI